MDNLNDKIALVTGASRGIGKAIALTLAGWGTFVLVHYAHSKDKAKAVQKIIVDEDRQAELVQAGFSKLKDIDRLFDQVDAKLKDRRLDILVNNAGIPRLAKNETITGEQFDHLVQVNFKAPFFLTRKAISRMNDGGRIINISSKASKNPSWQSGVYGMTKAALDNFTVQMASNLGSRKITVDTITPGPILTDMNREQFADEEIREKVANWSAIKGLGDPEDIAGIAAFLASPDAGWITGQWIEVSGGLGL